MRKKFMKWKRATAIATGVMLVAASTAGGIASLPSWAASYGNEYNLDVANAFQEFDGWGLSLSWWATEIGDWTRQGSSGMQKREEVMEAIYGNSGLNLNIARYNVGGGDDPSHTHMTDDRNTPGWRGATKSTATDPSGNEYTTYTANENYYFTESDGSTIDWQNTPDWRQLWVLDWIQSNRDDVLTEYYSNSPPYWMTNSGCTSGGVKTDSDLKDNLYGSDKYGNTDRGLPNENLPEGNNQLFVEYLLDVYEYLTSQGFTFENIQPFNESSSNYWYWGANGDQEGCHFSAQQQIEILHLLDLEMQKRGIDAAYNFGDETNTGYATDQYKRARRETTSDGTSGIDVVNGASRLTYHIYSYDINGAQQMYRNAHQNGQEIYMSEICFTEGSEYNPDAMDTGFKYTQSILDTVKYGGVDAYVFWQGVEDMVGQIKSGTNYGLIQGVYYTQAEAEAQGTDLAAMGLNYQDFVLSKAYYMSGQYTKYINQGYTIVDIDDDGSMAAISPDGNTLVVIKQNKNSDADSFKLNLGGFKASSVEKIYTDKTHNWAKEAVSTDGDSLIDTVGGSSVTTYVIHGSRTGRAGYFIDDSWATEMKTVADIEAKLTELGETEQFYATYSIDAHDCSKNSHFGSSYTNQEKYMAFRFKGTGFALTFPQKSDSGEIAIWIDKPLAEAETASVNLKSDTAVYKGIVYSTEELADGWHTVYVKSIAGKYVNFDGAFIYTAKDAAVSNKALNLLNVAGLDGRVKFDYIAEGYDGYEIFAETRVSGGDWVRGETALTGGNATVSVNGDRAQLRLVAVKDDEAIYSPVQVADILTSTDGVLYFVDSGTSATASLSTGAVLGELQSASDMKFGVDPFSGVSWGYTNTLKSGVTTAGYYGSDEAMTSMMALENVNEKSLEYQFTIPAAGTYKVALGFFGGGSSWGSRAADITVNKQTKSITLNEQTYTAESFTVTTTQANEILTVSVTNNSGNTFLSLIAITEEGVKLPLYTSAASNYNTQTAARAGEIYVGADLMNEVKKASFTAYFSDGTQKEYGATDTGVSYTVQTGKIVAGGEIAATLTAQEIPDVAAQVKFTWMQEGAEQLYYNIDSGFTGTGTPPDDTAGLIGSKQSTTHDRTYGADTSKGTSWGYVGDRDDVNWRDNGSNEWSIREEKGAGKNGTLTYKMTGFQPHESLKMMTGGHCGDNWGGRVYTVNCNGTAVGEIELKNGQRTYETFTEGVAADENGELTVTFVKKSGDNPQVGYIKVWSTGANLPKDAAIASDKTTVSREDTITLRNLNTAATVYVLDENDAVLGSFKPTGATASVRVSDYLPANSYELHFVQATANVTNVSNELVVDVPDVDFTMDTEWIEGGRAMAILFKPHAAHGVTSLTITAPDGATSPLTEGFFYRAKLNGEYTVKLVSNGATVVKTITVENIDLVNLEKTYSTQTWTSENVTLTLTPHATSGIAAVEVNGAPVTLNQGTYVIEATENGQYEVVIETLAGFRYEETVSVTNIDKSQPAVTLGIDFAAAGGLTLDYEAVSASGGKLYISVDGGAKQEVTESEAISLDREGKYEISFTSGTGVQTATQTYYVTYGAEKSQLASVTIGADGTVTVAEKARAVPQAKLYRAGESTAIASMKTEKAGKYYLEIESGNEKEIIVFSIAAPSADIIDNTKPAPSGNGGSNSGVMIAGIVIGCAALVAAGVVCTLLVLKGRKKQ